MKSKPRFNLKVILIGFLFVKIIITIVFLMETPNWMGIILGETLAVAKDSEKKKEEVKNKEDDKKEESEEKEASGEKAEEGTKEKSGAEAKSSEKEDGKSKENKDEEKAEKEEKKEGGKEGKSEPARTEGEKEKVTSEELRVTVDGLEQKRIWIQNEEKRLNDRHAELESLKVDIEAKIYELAKTRQQLEETLAKFESQISQEEKKKLDTDQAKIKQLVKVYTSMKPKTAASLIEKMDMRVVLKLFSNMKGEQIGSILSYMNKDQAAEISEKLAPTKKIPENPTNTKQ